MAHIIEMPKLSDDMTVGTIGRWHKKEGDAVKPGEALADVETDKATLELESHFGGILLKRFAGEGAKVAVDSPVCVIGEPGEEIEAGRARPANSTTQAAQPAGGEGRMPAAPAGRPSSAVNSKPTAPEPKQPAVAGLGAKAPASGPADPPRPRLRISPLARKLAQAKGIDPTTVTGSGPQGRILRLDILAAEAKRRDEAAAPEIRSPDGLPADGRRGVSEAEAGQSDRLVPHSPMRAAIARRLVESKTQIPHFYLEVEIDAAPLSALREQLNAAWSPAGTKISVNDFMLKASALALMKVPGVNSSWEGNGIRHHQAAHVSFAVAIEDGLVTPVIRDTAGKSLAAISREARALAAKARDRKLSPAEYTGGTFCVSNLGMMGVTRFSAIINPPNAAILAVGATVRKPVVRAGQIVIGERLTLTLSCDHRVVDGSLGARFLGEIRDLLENPFRMFFDLPAK
ncbi:MAG TPA: dihydrolipoamide acetyltransferase family protein [Lacunisphaera sp.]|nr:dihydrolipoamide acetyltransferase family protein [Lacunisphaera sp.]